MVCTGTALLDRRAVTSPGCSRPYKRCELPPAMPCPLLTPLSASNPHTGAGGGGLCVPLRGGNALPMPAAPQPRTLPYNALFMRSGRLGSEMPLHRGASPVPAVPLAARALSRHGTASLPALGMALPAPPCCCCHCCCCCCCCSFPCSQESQGTRGSAARGALLSFIPCPPLCRVTWQCCSHKSQPPALKGPHDRCLVRFS